jgi:hypothetical protein
MAAASARIDERRLQLERGDHDAQLERSISDVAGAMDGAHRDKDARFWSDNLPLIVNPDFRGPFQDSQHFLEFVRMAGWPDPRGALLVVKAEARDVSAWIDDASQARSRPVPLPRLVVVLD